MIRAASSDAGAARPGKGWADWAPYALIVVGVWLAWQIVSVPVADRAPIDVALTIAPSSPVVLRRSAEELYQKKDYENAGFLARRSIAAAPFDVRALYIVGVTEAQAGDMARADDIVTLAGNWSLRHDPTHAWLVDHRLRQGDLVSALAHADTLARRREQVQPVVFKLFSTAIRTDGRALGPVINLLAQSPPWRQAYFDTLMKTPEDAPLLASVSVALQATKAPLSDPELSLIYGHWLREGRLGAIGAVRARLNRPSTLTAVADGDFSNPVDLKPLTWSFDQEAGISAEITADDQRTDEQALRVSWDAYSSGAVVRQLLLLEPGAWTLAVDGRVEVVAPGADLIWSIVCLGPTVQTIAEAPPAAAAWARSSKGFTIPQQGCPAQWLVLTASPGERRGDYVAWFDKVAITKATR